MTAAAATRPCRDCIGTGVRSHRVLDLSRTDGRRCDTCRTGISDYGPEAGVCGACYLAAQMPTRPALSPQKLRRKTKIAKPLLQTLAVDVSPQPTTKIVERKFPRNRRGGPGRLPRPLPFAAAPAVQAAHSRLRQSLVALSPEAAAKSGAPWTADDKRRLRSLWRTGLTLSQMGQKIGRSRYAVHAAAQRLGLPNLTKIEWSPAEDEVIRLLYGPSMRQMRAVYAALPNRKHFQIRDRAIELRVRGQVRRSWTDAETALLRSLVAGGHDDAHIAKVLRRTVAAISQRRKTVLGGILGGKDKERAGV